MVAGNPGGRVAAEMVNRGVSYELQARKGEREGTWWSEMTRGLETVVRGRRRYRMRRKGEEDRGGGCRERVAREFTSWRDTRERETAQSRGGFAGGLPARDV